MTDLLFSAPQAPLIPVQGGGLFPVRRIFCVGRNYADHAREMGAEIDREAPFYFTKSPAAVTLSGATIPYAAGTQELHHEMELIVALGAPAFRIGPHAAMAAVFGYACGLDMTRRDLQAQAKDKRRPWDTGKDFDDSAIVAPITPAAAFGTVGPQRIRLSVNGAPRQAAHLADMVWTVPEIVAHLSTLYRLQRGDLIFTGTPAGVGAVVPGDRIRGEIDGLMPVELTIAAD